METINSFSGGMNKDVSKSLYKEGSYIHAENFTLITDKGLSTGSLRNANGNQEFVTVPDCSALYEITSITPAAYVDVVITANVGFYTAQFNNVNSLQQLGDLLKNDPNLQSQYFGVAYTDTRIIIYSLLNGNELVNTTINIQLSYYDSLGQLITSSVVPAISQPVIGPKIIGWEVIRDQVILFTASNELLNPTNELGQIWKLTYDKYLFNPVITLVYNGYLNFSLAHPIPNPGGTTGNFETPEIQKVYWTDNYNRPRVLNIADPNAMALSIDFLDTVPNLDKGVATVYNIEQSGALKTGIYQISARLANTAGNTSTFIVPSNPITIVAENDLQNYGKYEARDTGTVVSKSISGRLYNLDTQYDRIEPVILYRENPFATPDVFVLPSQPVPDNGVFSFTYSGTELVVPLSTEEFLEAGIVFQTVKTLTAKNNILFYGNVKYADFDVDFDCRAYRFSGKNAQAVNAQTSTLTDASGNTEYEIDSNGNLINIPGGLTWNDINFEADAVQDIDAQAPDSTNNFLFQADGETYGGQGPNVSYEFVQMYSINDRSLNSQYRTILDNSNQGWNGNYSAPYASVRPDIKSVNYSQDSPPETGYTETNQGSAFPSGFGPYGSYTSRGYQRDEMYRFGIVFFSKKGEPSYVHWVADIRMPKVYMPDPNATTGLNNDPSLNRNKLAFPITSIENTSQGWGLNENFFGSAGQQIPESGDVYGNNLGIKFTVNNLDLIADQISGYSIVRVKREDSDKTILAQGIINPIWYSPSNSTHDGDRFWFTSNLNSSWWNFSTSGYSTETTFSSPEFLFKDTPNFSLGDQLDFLQVSSLSQFLSIEDNTNNCANSSVFKMYNVWGQGNAPRSCDVAGKQTTPINTCESVKISQGQLLTAGTFNTYFVAGIPSTVKVANFGFTGTTPAAENCPLCPGSADSTAQNVPRGLGGTRSFLGFTTCPAGYLSNNGLDGLAFGVGNPLIANWNELLYEDYIIYHPPINTYSNIYIGNYRRPQITQYGGKSFSARAYNEYIPTGHTQLVNSSSTTHSSMIFGGDTYITLYDHVEQYRNPSLKDSGGTSVTKYSKTRNTIYLVPLECSFPVELRKQNQIPQIAGTIDDGYTTTPRCAPNKSLAYADLPQDLGGPTTAPDTTAEWTEDFSYEFDYIAENDVMKFFPAPYPTIDQTVFDVRIHRSQVKTNGELADSWGIFKTEDYLDLDTISGPLNNLIVHQNTLMSFQDRGVAAVSVNERSLTQDSSGSEIILGSGGVLARYDYLSRVIGSRHQFSFTKSHDAIFWFDMNTKNVYKMAGNAPVAITIAKGMTSYFSNTLKGLIQIYDNPYLDRGITATYDFRYNEAIMTFKDSVVDSTRRVNTNLTSYVFPTTYEFLLTQSPLWLVPGIEVYVENKTTGENYLGTVGASTGLTFAVDIQEAPTISGSDLISIYPYTKNSFTIGYNDFIDAFTSFYSFTPSVYVNDSVSIFSPESSLTTLYRHDVGEHSEYYGTKYPSKLTLLVNQFPSETKVFDNYEIVSESIDDAGTHITDDLFARIRLYNDYQNTDFQTLPTDTLSNKVIAKRKERTWNLSNLRNRVLYISSNSPDIFSNSELSTYTLSSPQTVLGDKVFGERMRDKYLIVDLEYDNLNNYNFVLHTFKTHFRKSAR